MILKNPGILPNIKIAIIGLLLILIPCIILSYIDYNSISKNSEGVKTNYESTANLIRDKIEQEILNREENLSAGLNELSSKTGSVIYLKSWLSNIESHNPFIINPFILRQDGGFVSTLISSQWEKNKIDIPQVSKFILGDYTLAEKAEYSEKDFLKAADLYRKCLNHATSEDSAIIINRIACCYIYNNDNAKAITEYKQLLNFKNADLKIASVPVSIVALSQIADIYNSKNDYRERFNTLMALYNRLLDNPWDLSDGKYFYYLKSVSSEIRNLYGKYGDGNSTEPVINKLKERELDIYNQDQFGNIIRNNILPEIGRPNKVQLQNRIQLQQLLCQAKDSTYQLGYFIIPGQKTGALIFGFQIKSDYMAAVVLPEMLKDIDLGKNLSVGLINEKGSFLYPVNKTGNYKILIEKNFGKIFTSWKVVLFNSEGKSLEQLVDKGKQQSFLLFGMTIFVMLTGVIIIVIAARHENRVSQMKTNFVSNVSHELKTPLSIIRMFSETLESGIVTDTGKRQEFYNIIKRESERLSNLINNVLDFSKIESRKKEFNFERTDMAEVVRNITEMYKPQLTVEGFKVDIEIPSKEIIVNIDKDAISQAILNLLNNALKYSAERKYVLIELYEAERAVVISVTDHGIGIPKKEYKNIFSYFYRIPDSGGMMIKGTGLGLTITKYIIEAHKGTISVESEVNKGSKFVITIPVSIRMSSSSEAKDHPRHS